MKDVINFFLSIIVGYVLTLALMLVFYFFMVDYIWLPPNASRHLMKPSVLFVIMTLFIIPWATISFALYKYMKKTILK